MQTKRVRHPLTIPVSTVLYHSVLVLSPPLLTDFIASSFHHSIRPSSFGQVPRDHELPQDLHLSMSRLQVQSLSTVLCTPSTTLCNNSVANHHRLSVEESECRITGEDQSVSQWMEEEEMHSSHRSPIPSVGPLKERSPLRAD